MLFEAIDSKNRQQYNKRSERIINNDNLFLLFEIAYSRRKEELRMKENKIIK